MIWIVHVLKKKNKKEKEEYIEIGLKKENGDK